jgi:hypothetical protein
LPYDVELKIAASPGRIEATEVTVRQRLGGPPVTARNLHRVPINRLLENAAMAVALRREDLGNGSIAYEPAYGDGDTYTLRAPQALNARGRAPLDEKMLGQVAKIYRTAKRAGLPTTRAVAEDERWGRVVPLKTAEGWVRAAKKRGFLND